MGVVGGLLASLGDGFASVGDGFKWDGDGFKWDGDSFKWDGDGWLMHWSRPSAVAALYLLACAVHNARLGSRGKARDGEDRPSALLSAVSVVHNWLLVAFSTFVCVMSAYHFAAHLAHSGLHTVLCQPPIAGGALPPPLGGRLHFWSYVFYLSKYYEMFDTVLLIARGKRVIPLHALHHAFIPLVMCVLFEGRVAFSLVALSVVNSFVHVVMYSYYLASALQLKPPLSWKRQITRLQIAQFSFGVLGGSYYWLMYIREPRLQLDTWPPLTYTEGCAGGEPRTVLVGYLTNVFLLLLFVSFYKAAYNKRRTPGSKPNPKRE